MISIFFGLPRAGKTTLLVSRAIKAVQSGKYRFVFSNVQIRYPGVVFIENSQIGKYLIEDGILFIDEATLFADNRDFKNFRKELVEFICLHGHFGLNIEFYTQQFDGVDLKIRRLAERYYYIYKPVFHPSITKYYRVNYGINIPDSKELRSQGKKYGEIDNGYSKPNLLVRIFAHRLHRKKWYKYFDSWEKPYLPPLQTLTDLVFSFYSQ